MDLPLGNLVRFLPAKPGLMSSCLSVDSPSLSGLSCKVALLADTPP